ncbi:MAG: hypothetical protein EOS58_06295 [Mesorhizobium sp.]|uniref:hypothetical protein n=1 Tax=Mesorhizobium sp. M4A.F.Ca.ET.022.05.2.1 TaxID=2496653 RepID=UPI000FCBF5CE|nr:hypothetical protein [Mesorhizobium sp. M4A.F.Ca.ET.022.05.2.1]RVC78065.1 hypothetical protein EN745_20125 [Mesorhizobium sp. M4A.F.Ca.ET.022.05.2.1]RWD06615.1 MAG: hypothetical protein EOS58_06295 [Mesorhizobium sp.]
MPNATNRFNIFNGDLATLARQSGEPADRTYAIRAAHEAARAAELAWPASKAKVPPPNGNQNLTLQQLNALAIGPNT